MAHVLIRPRSSPGGTGGYFTDTSVAYENQAKSLVHKEESSLIFSAKKLICIGEKFVPQTACLLSELNKNTAELSFGSSCTFISKGSNVNRNLHKVVYCAVLFLLRVYCKTGKTPKKKEIITAL